MRSFVPGLELSRRFYVEVVRPILLDLAPELRHAAALLGPGSDVLGFDTPMSTDHDWGPRLVIFLREADAALGDTIHDALRRRLPRSFLGYPTGTVGPSGEPTTRHMRDTGDGPVEHRVVCITLRRWAWQLLRYDPDRPLDPADWLTFPSQALRELTAGAVHFDGVGELTALRRRLAYYPHDVWLYLLAAGWQRIGQEEHLMPRAGYTGDELGSSLIGSRLVRDVMSLCFLMERRYAPYPKWLGTAFKQLACARELAPVLLRAALAENWHARGAALAQAYQYLAGMHNALGITGPMPESVSHFYDRPFDVIWGSTFADCIRAQITDPDVQRIAARRLIGNVDQWSDSTDLRSHIAWRPILRHLYAADTSSGSLEPETPEP